MKLGGVEGELQSLELWIQVKWSDPDPVILTCLIRGSSFGSRSNQFWAGSGSDQFPVESGSDQFHTGSSSAALAKLDRFTGFSPLQMDKFLGYFKS